MKAWNKAPGEWAKLDLEEQAEMIAFDQVDNMLSSYHYEEAKKDAKRKEDQAKTAAASKGKDF
jgi:hypothetical protein